jgi:predicted metal-binding protein
LYPVLPVLLVCTECEHHARHRPKQGRAMAGALGRLLHLLEDQEGLQDLAVEHRDCLNDCVLWTVCVVLKQGQQEASHHLSPQDDLEAVAVKLASPASAT